MSYTPKPGDIVTITGNAGEWLILAPAGSAHRPLLCDCPRGQYATVNYASSHTSNCATARHYNRPATYWLQDTATGALYRPNGHDEAVHKSQLTLVSAHSLPSRRELLAAELF